MKNARKSFCLGAAAVSALLLLTFLPAFAAQAPVSAVPVSSSAAPALSSKASSSKVPSSQAPASTPGKTVLQAPDQAGKPAFPISPAAAGAAVLLLIAAGTVLILRRKKGIEPPETEELPLIHTQKDASAFSLKIGNAHHIGARENQQDSFGISDIGNPALCMEKGVLAVVADGMGGLANGAQISATVTSVMLRYFETQRAGADCSEELLTMLGHANGEVNRFLNSGAHEQSGSTVVAALIKGNGLHFISVGDSRICLVRGGSLIPINREHTYASELDEKAARGEISVSQARSDPQRRALTSYIGMGRLEKIDRSLRPIPLQRGDRILLMTDGVFGTLSEQEILDAVGLDAYEAASALEGAVLGKKKPGQDNFTAVILQCV